LFVRDDDDFVDKATETGRPNPGATARLHAKNDDGDDDMVLVSSSSFTTQWCVVVVALFPPF